MRSHHPSLRPLGAALFLVVLALSLAGCPGQQTINKVTQHVTITQVLPGGTFSGFTGTSFGQAIPKGKQVHLLSATMESSSGEFSWITYISGSASMPPDAKVVVEKASFAGAKNPTELDIMDTGDLMPLFPDTQDFKVYWDIAFAAQPAQSYPNGIVLTFTYEVEIK